MPAAGALLCFSAAGGGGFLLGAKMGNASTAAGCGYEPEAIAACSIGGVSTNGGVGKVSGVLVFEVLKICLQFMGVDPSYIFIVQGFVTLRWVFANILRRNKHMRSGKGGRCGGPLPFVKERRGRAWVRSRKKARCLVLHSSLRRKAARTKKKTSSSAQPEGAAV